MMSEPEKARMRSSLDGSLDAFEKMSPEERQRDIDRANAFLRENGIDIFEKFDEWARK